MTAIEGRVPPVIPTLLIGAVGAALFHLIGFPAAPVTGPATAVAAATLLGLRTDIPLRLCDIIFIVIGAQIGSTVTPEVIGAALTWPLSLMILTVTLIVIMFVVPFGLRVLFHHSRVTAFLSSAPGHLTFTLGLAADMKADVPQVVLVQTVRVFLLTLLVPVLISLWGVSGTAVFAGQITSSAPELVAVLVLALAVGLVLKRLQVPAPLLIGAMAVSAISHGSGIVKGVAPEWLTLAAFISMGSLIGSRFGGVDRSLLKTAFLAGLFSTVAGCVIAAVGAYLAALLIGMPPAALFLAFAPGGVEVMAALAIETGLEPALVAAHHVFRLTVLGLLLPIFAIRYRHK
ncbi:MAG: AbrB family transcriptional regulator [Marivita sp.]|uniref:AbrB family transcriptional regulator n=1 Tax=Marivita sp. TaxID=2003365 RepID=UPI0025BC1B6A|nr:AbrB family transcriptional regulator [Marivita sp.]MCI5109871.1 AbrB family transcriptional regulator [Marivita sp.]